MINPEDWYPLQGEVTITMTRGKWRTIFTCLQSFGANTQNHGMDPTYVNDLLDDLYSQISPE